MNYESEDSDSDYSANENEIVMNNSDSDSESDLSSDVDTDVEYDSDAEGFEIEDDGEDIYHDDSLHMYSDKEHGKNYIGVCKKSRNRDIYVMANSVSARTFYRHQFSRIMLYLHCYSIVYVSDKKMDIMNLNILEDGTYAVIIKTFWLRLIQRHWKKTFQQRKKVIRGRSNMNSLRIREITGKFPAGLNRVPSLHGMLSDYSK
jgi:hypothetical protein